MDIRQFILPAGVGLTHIKVYDTPGPDGVVSGGAHIHLVCAEIYYILKGTGQLETLTMKGVTTSELSPGNAVFFRPGTFHRVLNPNRDIEILAIMQNGGLPERGDFVMAFPHDILTNPQAYATALRAATREDALRRRDLSVTGYLTIKDAFARSAEEGQAEMRKFYHAARNLIAPKVDGFEWVLKVGAQAEVKTSLDACDFLKAGRIDYLENPQHAVLDPFQNPSKLGMSGELHSYYLDESFLSEGQKQ